jgi:hypothetical protein
MTDYTEKAPEAAARNLKQITERLSRLSHNIGDYAKLDPRKLHWGHVGDLAYINSTLKELCDFLGSADTEEGANPWA